MLVYFTVENFRSFKKLVTLSMNATNIKELKESVVKNGRYRLLPVAVIYGANSSGKSNVIKAMGLMRNLVMSSSKLNPDENLKYDPFCLDQESKQKPTTFEIQFLCNETKYRYGFSYDASHIVSEYLFALPFGKRVERNLFLRAEDEYKISKNYFPEGINLESKTLKNRLFLTIVAQFNGTISKKVMQWFLHFNAINGIECEGYEGFTLSMFHQHLQGYEQAKKFFAETQLGFNNIILKKKDVSKDFLDAMKQIPDDVRKRVLEDADNGKIIEPFTTHNIYDDKGNIVGEKAFPESEMESEGTRKVIQISGPVFDTLIRGAVLMVDELDAKLHPLLTRHIVRLFMNPEINVHGSQLIFNTHDTNLLHREYFRRDQIWFTEKDRCDSTDLYSLVEFHDEKGNKIRNDSSFEKDYINGRYGAIPFIGGLRDE
jgi:AAA15 family ATPase/GTPase